MLEGFRESISDRAMMMLPMVGDKVLREDPDIGLKLDQEKFEYRRIYGMG